MFLTPTKENSKPRRSAAHACLRADLRGLLLLLLLLFPYSSFSQSITQPLDSNWQFSQLDSNTWLPATVPGTVHTDLMANHILPDPYSGENETAVQWVEKQTWEYKTVFDCDKKLWKQKNKVLEFEGLDTYADVYLNDSLLFTAEDMFLSYSKDVTKLIKKKKNTLRIVFHPASELIEKNKQRASIKNLPGGDRVYIRKAQYQFGWDWSPRMVTCGIWKNITLRGYTDFYISDATITTYSVDGDSAVMELCVHLAGSPAAAYDVAVSNADTTYYNDRVYIRSLAQRSTLVLRFSIYNPHLWWCNGLGDPFMYSANIRIANGKKSAEKQIRFGVRTIELITHNENFLPDFHFELNGKPVFIKGANWIPCSNFLPSVTKEKYYSLLKAAQQSNMNMLRVWGGGAYESDDFYSICDSLGILVWQDFMYACGMYPDDLRSAFIGLDESDDQLARLYWHPCVSLWCGNNENMEGWMNWDWQKDFSTSQQKEINQAYNLIFSSPDGDLAHTTQRYYGNRNMSYWPSSPSTGWGHPEAYKTGDVHYWGVWWGMEPFSAYETHVGRFMTEYGFQALPDERTFIQFTGNKNPDWSDSAVWKHQKHPTGFQTIDTYMKRDYPFPTNFSDYIYVSQVMQRDGIAKAIEAHRRAMPYCMGTMFWQYNDCWPVTSWSSIDYFGRPKLLQYALKDLYAPQMLSCTERNDSVLVYLVNDGLESFEHCTLISTVEKFDGQHRIEKETSFDSQAGTSECIAGFAKKNLLFDDSGNVFLLLRAVLRDSKDPNSKTIFLKYYYFAAPKNLSLPRSSVEYGVNVTLQAHEYQVVLHTKDLAKDVFLSIDDNSTTFAWNGFDMEPGGYAIVSVHSDLSADELKARLQVRTMNDLLRPSR